MFSDYFEVPTSWKAELKADLERDPPILGKQTLGAGAASTRLEPESLASSGQLGSSGVGYATNTLWLGYTSGPSIRWSPYRGANSIEFWADAIYFGAASQDMVIERYAAGYMRFRVDNLGFGAAGDAWLTRQGPEDISMWYQRLNLQKTAGINETPLAVNVGGVLKQVLVGPNNSAGGIGRQLYVANS